MDELGAGAALLRLLTWLSPAFPVGAFAYSGGLERAVHDGWVKDADGLEGWIAATLSHGAGWNDAVLLAEAWRECGNAEGLIAVAELAEALAGSAERHRETMALGAAFLAAAGPWGRPAGEAVAYPVAVGAVAGLNGVALEAALVGWLHAFAAQLVSAGQRLGVAGQTAGVAILARLEPAILALAARAAASTLDDLGAASMRADIAALRHETQYSRLFRS